MEGKSLCRFRRVFALFLALVMIFTAAPALAEELGTGGSVSANGGDLKKEELKSEPEARSTYAAGSSSVSFNGIFEKVTVETISGGGWKDVEIIDQDAGINLDEPARITWFLKFDRIKALAELMENTLPPGGDGSLSVDDFKFTFEIPQGIVLDTAGGSQDSSISDPDTGNPLANITITPDPSARTATLAFTEMLKKYAGYTGTEMGFGFSISAAWDKDALGNNGDQEMKFEEGLATARTVKIPMKVRPAKAKANFSKKGEVGPDKTKMIWNITADPSKADPEGGKTYEDTTVREIKVSDTLPKGLTMADTDVKVYQGDTLEHAKADPPLASGEYEVLMEDVTVGSAPDAYTAKKATVTIKKPIDTQGDQKYFVVLETAVDPARADLSKYKEGDATAGLQYSFNNTLHPESVKYDEKTGNKTGAPTNNAETIEGTISFPPEYGVGSGPLNVKSPMLTKSSARVGDKIKWTLTVNESAMDIGETLVTDVIDTEYLELTPEKITYAKGSDSPADLNVGSADAYISQLSLGADTGDHHRTLAIKIGDCKEKCVIEYETTITKKLDSGRGIQNSASLSSNSIPGPLDVVKQEKAGSVIRKTVREDQPNDVLEYTISLNENYAAMTHVKVRDFIPGKLRLVDDATLATMNHTTAGGKEVYTLMAKELGVGTDKCVRISFDHGYGAEVTPTLIYTVDTTKPEGHDERYLLEVEFGDASQEIKDAYSIILRPKVIADEVWKANRVKKPGQTDADFAREFKITNTAEFTADAGAPPDPALRRASVTTDLNHTVIRKAYMNNSYNAAEHSFKWKITVNGDDEGSYKNTKVPLKNPQVTEILTDTQAFLIDSSHKVTLKVGGASEYEIGTAVDAARGYYEIDTVNPRKMKVHLPNSAGKAYLDEKCEITLYSQINNDDIVKLENLTDADVIYENEAVLSYDGSNVVPPARLTADAQAPVPPAIFDKSYKNAPSGGGLDNKQQMEWSVVVNKNGFHLINPEIEDVLPENLYLDITRVKLYNGPTAAAGEMTKGVDYTLKCETVEQTGGGTHQNLTVSLKKEIRIPCLLTYTTYVIPNSSNNCPATTFTNTVRMAGGGGGDYSANGTAKIQFFGGTAWGNFKNGSLGSITVTKKDAGDGTFLPGAKFLLESADKSYSATLTSDASGKAVFENLPLGQTYTVKEIGAPTGYGIDDDSGRQVALSTTSKTGALTFTDTLLKEAVTVVKKDAETGELLEGAEFVFKSPGKPHVPVTTGPDGKAAQPLPLGTWTVEETAAPAGYVKSTEVKTVTVTAGAAMQTLTFKNTSNKGDLTIYKKDRQSGAGLAGAEFEIRKNGADGIVYQAVTDAGGKATATIPAVGSYTVTEVKAPEYYLPDSLPQTVAPEAGGSTFPSLVFTDTRITGSLLLTKRDRQTREPLAGTKFRVARDDGTFSTDVITDQKGEARADGLPIPGDYTVAEVTPPDYYNNDSTPWKVSLTAADIVGGAAVKQNEFTDTRMDEYNLARLIIEKQDSGSKRPLGGAVFVLRAQGRNPIEVTTDENGLIDRRLPAGDWEIEEIKAPAGYHITGSAKRNVSFQRDQEMRVTVENHKDKEDEEGSSFHAPKEDPVDPAVPPIPNFLSLTRAVSAAKTGDYAPLAGLAVLCAALLAAIIGCGVWLFRRRKRQ